MSLYASIVVKMYGAGRKLRNRVVSPQWLSLTRLEDYDGIGVGCSRVSKKEESCNAANTFNTIISIGS